MILFNRFACTAAMLGVSCLPAMAQSIVTRTEMNNINVSARNNPMAIFRTAAPRTWDMTHAQVALSFDYAARTAEGTADIKLFPAITPQDSVVLDAKNMQIGSVAVVPSSLYESHSYDGRKLVVHLKKSVRVNDTLRISVRYTARPYYVPPGGQPLPSDEQGLYFINADRKIPGKPVQIWTQGETEENSVWMPMIDKPNERFTAEIALTVPDSFKTVSNGLMTASKKIAGGLRTDTWKMDKPIPAYTYAFAIGSWAVIKDKPWNGKEISYYVDPEYADVAKRIFQHTQEMMTFFSGATGVPFAWPKFSQVIIRDFVSGAMENVSVVTFGEFVQQNARELVDRNFEDIVSHELFHHWFGDYVTAESWSNLTVNESFANYGEQLWRKYFYGTQSADELAWADQRRYVDQTEESDPPLARYHYRDESDLFDRISYEKGGAVLRYINGLMGDTLFFKAMNIYLTRNALQPAEVADWRKAVEQASGTDWMPFFNQWYFREGHPRLSIRHSYDDAARKLTITVRQKSAPDTTFLYELPVKVRVLTAGGSLQEQMWTIKKRSEKLEIPYPGGERPVAVFDAEHWVPAELTEEGKTPADLMVQLKRSPDYVGRRFALNGAYRLAKEAGSADIFRAALQDNMQPVRAYALELLQRVKEKSYAPALKADVMALFRREKKGTILGAAMDVLAGWEASEVAPELYPHLRDSSYTAAGAALNAIGVFNSDSAYAIAKRMYGEDNRGSLEEAVMSAILVKGKAADLPLLEARASRSYGRDKISFAYNLASFAYFTKDDKAYERALTLISDLARSEGIPDYRSSIATAAVQMVIIARKEALGKEDKEKARRFRDRVSFTEGVAQRLIDAETDAEIRSTLTNLLNTKVEKE